MAEIRTVTTLTAKRETLERAILGYEKALEQARADLAAVVSTIALFEREANTEAPRYADVSRLYRRGEMVKIAKAALASGPLDTRELAAHVLAARGFNTDDPVLRQAVMYRLVQALRLQHLRGAIGDAGRRKGVRVWLCS